jgi:tetratricopeptide (TPR) repeat protein
VNPRMTTDLSTPKIITTLLHCALAHHLEHRLVEAEALYRQILDQDPDHGHALGMLALILAGGADEVAAETALLRHLVLRPADGSSLHELGRLRVRQGDDDAAIALFRRASQCLPNLAPIYNDLGMSLYRLGHRKEALAELDHAIALGPAYGFAHGNRGIVLSDSGRFEEALDALLEALAHTSSSSAEFRASTLHNLCRAAHKTGKINVAEAIRQVMLDAGHSDSDTVEELALILDYAGRSFEALAIRNDLTRRSGILRGGRSAELTLLLIGGVGAGNIPSRYLVDSERFTMLSVGLLSPDQADAPLGAIDIDILKSADVVFNTVGNADREGGQLDAVTALCARLGKPVLNPPHAIRKTSRAQAPILFRDIPGMVIPAVRQTTASELASIPVDTALLVRPAGDHGGDNLFLLRDDADKARYLKAAIDDRLLVTKFHDFQSGDGYWRKYRLIFVDRHVYPYHLVIGDDWLLHYWRASMGNSVWKKAEEEHFLADWRDVFGDQASRAVEDAARRLGLDYGGMDCALTPEGEVLLFEANACMLVHLDEPAKAFPYKHRYVPIIRDAFSQMVRDRAAGRRSA